MIEHVRLSPETRDRLIVLKRRTGIRQWNILCRWAFCISLAEAKPPPIDDVRADSNVEMTWRTFAGKRGGVLAALLKTRCLRDGMGIDDEALAVNLRAHLRRGASYLITKKVQSIADLLFLSLAKDAGNVEESDAETHGNRGLAKANLNDWHGALEDYTEAITINPQYAKAYYNRGIAKRSLGDEEGAEADFRKAKTLGLSIEEDTPADD